MRLLAGLLFSVSCFAQLWSGIIASSRAEDWSSVGVQGGIPSGAWSQCTNSACNTAFATPTAANINAAIASAPAHTYVLLPAGTFSMSATLLWNSVSNVALRGAGSNSTILSFTGAGGCQGIGAAVCFASSDPNYWGGPSNVANWTAGYSVGTTSITLSSKTNLAVGSPITLDQLDSYSQTFTSGWANTSGNIWQVADTTTPTEVFFNATAAGTQVGSQAAVTAAGDWYYDGSSTLYVYSTSNPATAFTAPPVTAVGDNGAIFTCYTPQYVCSANGDDGGSPRTGRSQQQIVEVTSISGTGPYTIGISPGLVMPNWSSGQTPQAWWPTSPVFYDGIENLTIKVGSSGASEGLAMFNCVNCWEQNVASIGAWGRSHTQVFQSSHCSIINNYFYLTNSGASVNYGVETIPSSDTLVQNNIFHGVQAAYPSTGTCTGCVYSYNFDTNDLFSPNTWQNQSGFPHAVGDEHILYEGNIGAGIYSDDFHGTHEFQTIFRNYYNGYQKNNGSLPTSSTIPLLIDAYSRFYNIIGNVLGNAAAQNAYEDTVTDQHSGSVPIYYVGYGDLIPNDSNTVTTLMRWGNYDVVTGTSRFVSSEVPSGLSGAQTAFANSVPGSDTIPASFYLSTQPSWWTSGKAWPPIGPDVSGGNVKYCTGGANTGTYVLTAGQCPSGTATTLAAGHIVSNPAMDCYLNTMVGPPDGTGSALTFNSSACYTSSSAGGSSTGGTAKAGGTAVRNLEYQ